MDIHDKNLEFEDLLTYIAQNPLANKEEMDSVLDRFYELYKDGYRHSYSTILRTIDSLEEDMASYLDLNLSFIEEAFDKLESSDKRLRVRKSFDKLKDHVKLEIIHMAQYKKYMMQDLTISENVENIKKTLAVQQQESIKVQENLLEMESKLSHMNNELSHNKDEIQQLIIQLVTVLGIFATIVVAFTGSFNLLASAFANIGDVSKYRLFAMVLVVGIVLYNTVFLMIYGISKIARVSIFETCKHGDCSMQRCTKTFCWFIPKVFRQMPFVFWGNFAMIFCMGILIILWYLKI